MKVCLTTLSKDQYFEYDGKQYKKLDNREKSGRVLELDGQREVNFPLMMVVDKIDQPSRKKTKKVAEPETKKEDLDEQKPLLDSFRLRNRLPESGDGEHSADSSDSD